MTRTYHTRPTAWEDESVSVRERDKTWILATQVHEAEPVSKATGVLNASGQMIYAREEMGPIGFMRLK